MRCRWAALTTYRKTSPSPGSFSDREAQVLQLLWRLRFLSAAQLAEFLFLKTTFAASSRPVLMRRVLRSLRRAGLVASTHRMLGGPLGGELPPAYYLTTTGQRVAAVMCSGQPGRSKAAGSVLLRHALATADVVLAFTRSADAHEGQEVVHWESDREAASRIGTALLVPDAYLIYRVGARELHAFLEVDLGTEYARAFAEKLSRYLEVLRDGAWRARYPVWPFTLVIAETGPRVLRLRNIATDAFASSIARSCGIAASFHFAVLADVLAADGPLAQIWERIGSPECVALQPGPEQPVWSEAHESPET